MELSFSAYAMRSTEPEINFSDGTQSPVSAESLTAHPAVAAVYRWLNEAVIGLNLCPFAKAVQVRGQIRWVVLPDVTDEEQVRLRVLDEMQWLAQADPQTTDTTLIIAPDALHDFHAFSLFVDSLSSALKRLGLRGVLQVASFHPQFEFAGEPPEDRSHYTNRAPAPVIHLLREASLTRAIERHPDPDQIWRDNIERLSAMDDAKFEHVFLRGNWTTKP